MLPYLWIMNLFIIVFGGGEGLRDGRVPVLDSAQRGIDHPHKRRSYPDLPPGLGPWPRHEPLNQASSLIPAVRCRTEDSRYASVMTPETWQLEPRYRHLFEHLLVGAALGALLR
jgi:hypothetical protein